MCLIISISYADTDSISLFNHHMPYHFNPLFRILNQFQSSIIICRFYFISYAVFICEVPVLSLFCFAVLYLFIYVDCIRTYLVDYLGPNDTALPVTILLSLYSSFDFFFWTSLLAFHLYGLLFIIIFIL